MGLGHNVADCPTAIVCREKVACFPCCKFIFRSVSYEALRILPTTALLETTEEESILNQHWKHLDEVRKVWEESCSSRRIVTEFLADKEIGKKRLASMPDRVTNTINVMAESKETRYRPPPACRPTVINNYEGDLSTTSAWWTAWKDFLFVKHLLVLTKRGVESKRPCEMLEPIRASKYPAVTPAEEQMSLPLQTLFLAIFDAILVHLMNTISPCGDWQLIKSTICQELVRGKPSKTVDILSQVYGDVDVMCLQEAAAVFVEHIKSQSSLASSHILVVPEKLDGKRDQNCLVLLKRSTFGDCKEVTEEVLRRFQGGKAPPFMDGDLTVVEARHLQSDQRYAVVSFHGDSSGLLTIPTVEALHACKEDPSSGLSEHRFLLGLDANVFEDAEIGGDKQSFKEFVEKFNALGMSSCFGPDPDVANCRTTCNSRTFLQTQLQKGLPYEMRILKSDQNPKDTILFYKDHFKLAQEEPTKDNTAKMRYMEATLFPTMDFPSDHGIVATVLSTRKA